MTDQLFSLLRLLLLDARARVGTFLLFLVLFAGTGASRGQAGLSALAVQTCLRRPKQAADAPGAGGRKEGEREREKDGLSNFPVIPDGDLKANVSRSGAQTLARLF